MSYYGTDVEVSFDYPASTVARTHGGFSASSNEVVGRWVVKGTGNTVLLAGGTNVTGAILGVIISLGPNKVGVALGPILKGKRTGDTALAVGARIKAGAARVVAAGETAQPGFIEAEPYTLTTVAALRDSTGVVLEGGAASTANTEPTSDQWVTVLMGR